MRSLFGVSLLPRTSPLSGPLRYQPEYRPDPDSWIRLAAPQASEVRTEHRPQDHVNRQSLTVPAEIAVGRRLRAKELQLRSPVRERLDLRPPFAAIYVSLEHAAQRIFSPS